MGNLFEAVLSQTFYEPCPAPPSEVFRRLRQRNPSPYGFLLNLGATEYLVGASPEMFVRVERNAKGWRCETCPISGTIRRGRDALEDAERIKQILSDKKEESELTMCTDVDRNDKSRICRAGSVQVIGRRQIEMYSRLIHTVIARPSPRMPTGTLTLTLTTHRYPPPRAGRSRRGLPARGLRCDGCLPRAHVGGHGDRRAEDLGDQIRRGAGGEPAVLVRWGGGAHRL